MLNLSNFCNVTEVGFWNNNSIHNIQWKGFLLQDVQVSVNRVLLQTCLGNGTINAHIQKE